MITFRCPKCQTVQDVRPQPGSAVVTCSTCAARLQMPETPLDAVSATPAPRLPATARPAGADEWFCTIAGQHRGPFTEAEVQRLVDRDELRPSDPVWRTGWPQWRPARDFFQFPESRLRPRRAYEEDDDFRRDRRRDDRYEDRYEDRDDFYRGPRPYDDTASITCGILSIVGGVMSCIPCFVGFAFGVAGVVLAIVSLQGRDKALGGVGLSFSLVGIAFNLFLTFVMLSGNRF